MSDEFKPGQRVEIQDRDCDPDRYPQATIVRAATRQGMFGNHDVFGDQRHDRGYVVRRDDGQEEWVQEWDVLAMRNPDSRAVEKAAEAMKADGWHAPLIGDDLNDDVLYRIAQTVLRAGVSNQALPYAAELAAFVAERQWASSCIEKNCCECPARVTAAAIRLADAVSRAHQS